MSLDAESFDRAWNAGYLHGAQSAAVALAYEAVAHDLLASCGFHRSDTRAIWEQAQHEAQMRHPDLTEVERRALAARRISRLLIRGVLQRRPVGFEAA
jgi:hypothetical protein